MVTHFIVEPKLSRSMMELLMVIVRCKNCDVVARGGVVQAPILDWLQVAPRFVKRLHAMHGVNGVNGLFRNTGCGSDQCLDIL